MSREERQSPLPLGEGQGEGTAGRRGEKGQLLIILALGMTALIGTLALALDAGYAMATQRRLQNAADAAVLAGTRQVDLGVPTQAQPQAIIYAQYNGVPDTDADPGNGINGNVLVDLIDENLAIVNLSPSDAVGISVTVKTQVNALLASVLERSSTIDLSAAALATAGSPAGETNSLGFAVYDGAYVPGGTYWLWGSSFPCDVCGSSAFKGRVDLNDRLDSGGVPYSSAPNQTWEYYVQNGYPNTVWVGDRIAALSGVSGSNAADPLRAYITNHQLTDGGGIYAVLIVPVFNAYTTGSPDRVTISGFAAFKVYYNNVSSSSAMAVFVNHVAGGQLVYGNNYGVRVVKMGK